MSRPEFNQELEQEPPTAGERVADRVPGYLHTE